MRFRSRLPINADELLRALGRDGKYQDSEAELARLARAAGVKPRAMLVLGMRHGCEGNPKRTLQAIADILTLTREGVRTSLSATYEAIFYRVKEEQAQVTPPLQRRYDELGLSTRARHGLEVAEIKTVSDLVAKTATQLLEIKHFGLTSLGEVVELLERLGLSLEKGDERDRQLYTKIERKGEQG